MRRWVLLCTVSLLLVAWGAVAALLWVKWREAFDAEIRQNINLARVVEEQTVRVLATADQAMLRVAAGVGASPSQWPDLVRYADETGLAPNILVQLAFIDTAGRLAASNLDPDGKKNGPVNLAEREHVKLHLSPPGAGASAASVGRDELFIGKPVIGKVSQKWSIQLSRRISAADGSLRGVVVASLDPGYFENVYRRVSLGRLGGMTLLGTDLVVRARVIGGESQGVGSSVGANSGFAKKVEGRQEGYFINPSAVDGVERIFVYRRVGSYPLYLLVTASKDEALAGWRAMRNVSVTLSALLSVAVVLGAALFMHGLRRMERSNEALRRSEAQAKAANDAKTDFLAAVSHELRTPLTSIRGFSELLEQRLPEAKFRTQAGMIRKAAEHLTALLTEILDLAKVEAGAMRLNCDAVELRPLLQGTSEFFAVTASEKGLALELDVAQDVPETLNCDGLRLKQILNNLLSNAMKFTAQGRVKIGVGCAKGALTLYVEDTGPGIPEALHETIFEKFRQASSRVANEHGGTGLGLALSRQLAELMGGRLAVTSTLGVGSRFTLTLPLEAAPA